MRRLYSQRRKLPNFNCYLFSPFTAVIHVSQSPNSRTALKTDGIIREKKIFFGIEHVFWLPRYSRSQRDTKICLLAAKIIHRCCDTRKRRLQKKAMLWFEFRFKQRRKEKLWHFRTNELLIAWKVSIENESSGAKCLFAKLLNWKVYCLWNVKVELAVG